MNRHKYALEILRATRSRHLQTAANLIKLARKHKTNNKTFDETLRLANKEYRKSASDLLKSIKFLEADISPLLCFACHNAGQIESFDDTGSMVYKECMSCTGIK